MFFLIIVESVKSESPFTIKPARDYLLLGVGTLTGVSAYFVLDKEKSLTHECISSFSRYDVNAFDRGAVDNWSPGANKFSEAAMALSISAMLPLIASPEARSDGFTIGVMTAETLIWAISLPQLSKMATLRYRPYVYNESVNIEDKLEPRATESFFSRTTTVAFASAVFSATLFDAYYPNSPYSKKIWIGSLTCASLAGYLRYYSGQHFTTDVLAGALVGSFIGWAIPYMHRNDRQNHNNVSFGVSPAEEGIKAVMVMKF